MIIKKPEDFLPPDFTCTDHHYVEPENNGSVFHHEGSVLHYLASMLGGPVLELGANRGISSRYILHGLRAFGSNQKLYSVDIRPLWPEDPGYPERVRISANSATFRPPPCRWAFIDGDHSYDGVKADILTALRAAPDYLLFHDTDPTLQQTHNLGVRQAVLDSLSGPLFQMTELTTHCGLILAEHIDNAYRPQHGP